MMKNEDNADGIIAEYPPSPVPSDRNLWPGEKPFTAFGQWGEGQMDNRVFDQDIYWVNIKGEPFLLTDMSEEYRLNVILFLRENMAYYAAKNGLRVLLQLLGDAFIAPEGYADLDQSLESVSHFTESTTPEEWLESTPLMKKLRELTGEPAPQ